MKSFLLSLSLSLLLFTSSVLAAQTPRIRILLGKDYVSSSTPFLDAYTLSEQLLASRGIKMDASEIDVDTEIAIPERMGIYAIIRAPKDQPLGEFEKSRSDILSLLKRYGVTDVTLTAGSDDQIEVVIRVGIDRSRVDDPISSLRKFLQAAEEFSDLSIDCVIELYDELGMRSKMETKRLRYTTANEYGMEGMNMMGMGMGKGGFEEMSPVPNHAQPTGSMSEGDIVLSWSIPKRRAAAISTTRGGGWTSVLLESDDLSPPIVSSTCAVFFCGPKLHAYSATAARWDTLDFETRPDQQPQVYDDKIILKTAEDYHVFTAVSGQWWSQGNGSPSGNDALPNKESIQHVSEDPFSPTPTAAERDIFGKDPFGDGSSAEKVNPFSDPFDTAAPRQPTPSNDPFAATPPAGPDPFAMPPRPAQTSVAELEKSIADLRGIRKVVEARIRAIAEKYPDSDPNQKAELTKGLAQNLAASFQYKQQLELIELQLLETKIETARQKIEKRNQNRREVLTKRLKSLTEKPSPPK